MHLLKKNLQRLELLSYYYVCACFSTSALALVSSSSGNSPQTLRVFFISINFWGKTKKYKPISTHYCLPPF